VTLLEGSYRQERVLRSAGAQTANALVVTEDDDVGNVHAALVAHDLNPRLRLRLRMFNQELGNRVQLLFRDCQILDAAAMAVPAFVSAALHRDRQQRLRVGDRSLVVRPASASEPDVLLPLARSHPRRRGCRALPRPRRRTALPRRRRCSHPADGLGG
jgi:hypothetical protein